MSALCQSSRANAQNVNCKLIFMALTVHNITLLTFVRKNPMLICLLSGKWYEPRGISYLFGMIVQVRVVFGKTVVGD